MNNLCNNCIHKDVCSRWTATWGMKTCEHFMEMPKKGKWEQVERWATKAKYRCSVCGREIMSATKVNIEKYPYCHCGADMRGK